MVKPRRGLSEALDLTPEKVAFIRQERTVGSEVAPDATNPDQLEHRGEGTKAEVASPAPVTSQRTAQALPEKAASSRPVGPHNLALVPLTTRLQPATAAALRRAYLERKINGEAQATQQEIVEEALQDWLRSTGFLD